MLSHRLFSATKSLSASDMNQAIAAFSEHIQDIINTEDSCKAKLAKLNFLSQENKIISDDELSPKTGLYNRHTKQWQTTSNKVYPIQDDQAAKSTPNKAKLALEDSFTRHMLKIYIQQALGPLGMGIGLATALPSAAAAPSNYSVISGYPQGGSDLCKDLFYCVQEYVQDNTGTALAQFSRVVQSTSSQADASTLLGLENCFARSDLVNLINDIINNIPAWSESGLFCSASSSIWQNTQMQGQATGLSNSACVNYQNGFSAEAGSCQNLSTLGKGALEAGAIAGIVIGAIAATFGTGYLAYYLYKKMQGQQPVSCCDAVNNVVSYC